MTEHKRLFLTVNLSYLQKKREETEMENVKCVSLADEIRVTCRPVGLVHSPLPSRQRGRLDVHIWPCGCSSRQSLFNNTVPGLSWLS